jgi:hypothetical protein
MVLWLQKKAIIPHVRVFALTVSPCDGASFIEIRNLQHSIGDAVLDFDLDLVMDLDSFNDRASLDR